jgi:hypothetical protein
MKGNENSPRKLLIQVTGRRCGEHGGSCESERVYATEIPLGDARSSGRAGEGPRRWSPGMALPLLWESGRE